MLPIDPGDGQGSVTPARPVEDIVPFQGRVPAQAMARGGTIIRPGAVAWGGMRDASDSGYSSCEAIERILASVVADPSRLPGLLAELTTTQLWVPLPAPFIFSTSVWPSVVSTRLGMEEPGKRWMNLFKVSMVTTLS